MAGRRGNGEGSIYYSEKLNRWVGQFTNGVKTNGTPNRKSVYGKTRKEVADKITKALNEIKEHTFVDKSDITFIELLRELVEEKYRANLINDSTYKRNLYQIKEIEETPDTIAYKPIQKITNPDIKKFFFSLTKFSNGTISKLYGMTNKTFQKAVSKKLIYSNPLDDKLEIIKPKSDKADKKVEALTIDEEEKLINVLNSEELLHPYRNIILLLLFTGMRCGEVLALRKENITENSIIIDATLSRDKSDKVILGKTTKTYSSTREILITEQTKPILHDILFELEDNPKGMIFWDKNSNTFVKPVEINCYLQRICKKYNIAKHIHTHMLRHTFATRCIESGMTAVVLAKKLGHKDISITLNTYTSVFAKYEDTQDDRYVNYMKDKNLVALKLH